MVVLSVSKIKLWKRCPQAYYYKYVEGIEPRLKAVPLERGGLLHEMLENYYTGKDWRKPIEKYREKWDSLMEEERDYYGGDLPEECLRIMEGYVRKYKNYIEKPLAIELDFSDNPVEVIPHIYLKGRIDLIIKDKKGCWVTEHKSHKKIPSEEQRFFDLQSSIYMVVSEILGYKIDGILWNYLRTKPPTIPRVLVNGRGISRAKDIDTDYDTYYDTIIENGFKPSDYKEELQRASKNIFYLRRYLPKSERLIDGIKTELKTIGPIIDKLQYYPYRVTNKMVCNGCGYRALCQAELLGLDAAFIRRYEYKPVDERREIDDGDEG